MPFGIDPNTLITSLFGFFGILLGAWWQSRRAPSQARQDESSAASGLADAANTLIAPYRAEVETLRGKVAVLETNQAANIKRIGELETHKEKSEGQRQKMQAQIDRLLEERHEWKQGIDMLIAQLRELEIKPAWVRKDTGPLL